MWQERFAVWIQIRSQPVFGDMDRHVQQFDMLDNFKLVGWSQVVFSYIGVVDFIGNPFIHTLWWKRLA